MKIKFWLGLIISLFFVWLAFRKVDYTNLWVIIKSADYFYLIPAIILTMLQFFLRALRWGYILEPIKKIGVYSLFSATSIGFMANNVLPARIGEFVKAYVMGKKEDIKTSSSFATIVIERIMDIFAIFVLMLFVLYAIVLPPDKEGVEELMHKSGGLALIFFLFGMLLLVLFKKNKDIFKRLSCRFFQFFSLKVADKMDSLLESFAKGLSVLTKGKHLAITIFLSMAVWIISALPIYLVMISFGHVLPFSISIFILLIIAFAVAAPSAPGFIGTFHYACALGLEIFNVPSEDALSVAIILHAVNFFPITIVGMFFLWKDKISLKEAEKLEDEGAEVVC